MSYTPPLGTAVNFSWVGEPAYAPPSGNALNFSFLEGPSAAGAVTLAVTVDAIAVHGVAATGAVTLDVSVDARARFITYPTVATTRAPWVSSAPHDTTLRADMPPAQQELVGVRAPWGIAVRQDGTQHAPWSLAGAVDDLARAPWGRYERLVQPLRRTQWAPSKSADDASTSPWGRYERWLQHLKDAAWAHAAPLDDASRAPWLGPMRGLDDRRSAPYRGSVARDTTRWVPWTRFSRTLQPSWSAQIPEDDGTPTVLIVVPVRRVYVTINDTSLRRVADNMQLPALRIGLSIDRSSWAWSMNASLPADTLPYLQPVDGEPVELEAAVNGHFFRVLVEGIARERTFGDASIAIRGRGKIARLDAPYAPLRTFQNDEDLTVQQIAALVLTENGVSIGWDVAFAPEDWLVPAGLFVHRGSYISALNEIAAAAGAYIQPHPTADALSMLPAYPYAPWEWATLVDPDFEIPVALAERESIEWTDKPNYNRVYVSGQGAGVLGRVTRAGTAGDQVAQSIVHPLITAAAAARQRGLPVLAETGRMTSTALRLPVLSETGIITPGAFVRYDAKVGIVRGVSVDVTYPEVWQTITLETHE